MPDRPIKTNADDPTADRLAAYPEAGELGSPQDTHPTATEGGPVPPQPAGVDTEIIMSGGSGGGLGGPPATDAPGEGAGMPGEGGIDEESPANTQRAERAARKGGSFVDRLDR